ncbi:MAG: VCBS repeat-containing protein [Gemmatimonadetes bacterium]|nr:VCBS repeat-containing protein [Gemmatimonadota bacterium]
MHRKSLTLATTVTLAFGVIFLAACSGGGANPPAQFQAHDIADFSGYSVAVADFNNDGRLDVIANSLGASEVAWYENPTWERHVIIEGVSSVVNQAMADINGDGIPEIAYQSGFAMVAANSMGFNTIAMSQGDPTMPWTTQQIDAFPTSHHVAWADLDGDGELELINALLIGEESVRPAYDQDQSSVFWYGQGDWKRGTVDDEIPGIIHRVRPVKWDPGSRDQLLVASFEGIALYRAIGMGDAMTFEKELISSGHDSEPAPRLGASDVGMGASGSGRIVASVEPWHGNEVVVYTEQDGTWQRRVLFSDIGSGHEIAVLDLNGDGYADIVANDQSRMTTRNPDGTPGVHVFFSPEDPATGEWIYRRIETESAMNGCVGGDMNEDGRPDLICTGGGGKIIWYENLGNEEAETDM